MNILVLMKLSDKKCRDKLIPLTLVDNIGKIVVLRRSRGFTLNKVEYITPPRFFQVNSIFLNIWRLILGIYLIKKEDIDVIISYYFIPHNILALIIGSLLRRPIIISLIGTDVNNWLENLFLRQAFLSLLKKNSQIFVTGRSSALKLKFKGVPYQKVNILPNSIDVEVFTPYKGEKTIECIFVGSLVQVKRVDIIIEIIEMISKKFDEIRLVIVGSGPEEQNLRKKVQLLNLTSNIRFIGYTSKTDYWLNKSKILILTSKSEGRPAVIMEAMICGTVPVVLNVGDISDMCNSGVDSILIDNSPDFKSQFTEQIMSLLNNKEHYNYLSKNALKRKKDFSYFTTAAVWKKAIKKVI